MNRQALLEAVDATLSAAGGERITGVLLIRLLRVREFLQVYGYVAGDALGEVAAEILQSVLRPQDRLHRVGEFEFVAVLQDLHDINHASLAAARVVRAFSMPVKVNGGDVMAAVAVGVAVSPFHGTGAERLLRCAEFAFDRAMQDSQRMARHDPDQERRLVPYGQLREALTANRMEAWLQPIYDLRRQRVVAAESLSRWNEPGLGMVPPDVFIPMSERTGLISDLTWWSINASLRHLASIRRVDPSLSVSINLSPRVFGEPGLVEHLSSTLQVWGVPPGQVTLEVTETALMEDPAMSERLLQRLRAAGFGVAFDDFGTGYSSLAYLKRFPATELKIDRAFIHDLPHDPRSLPLVRTIVELAHQLDLVVVAEGVEDAETMELLAQVGCDRAQGYYIRRPRPVEEFLRDLDPGAQVAAGA